MLRNASQSVLNKLTAYSLNTEYGTIDFCLVQSFLTCGAGGQWIDFRGP